LIPLSNLIEQFSKRISIHIIRKNNSFNQSNPNQQWLRFNWASKSNNKWKRKWLHTTLDKQQKEWWNMKNSPSPIWKFPSIPNKLIPSMMTTSLRTITTFITRPIITNSISTSMMASQASREIIHIWTSIHTCSPQQIWCKMVINHQCSLLNYLWTILTTMVIWITLEHLMVSSLIRNPNRLPASDHFSNPSTSSKTLNSLQWARILVYCSENHLISNHLFMHLHSSAFKIIINQTKIIRTGVIKICLLL
jgi:hypothetical protein